MWSTETTLCRDAFGVLEVGSKALSRNIHFVSSEENWSALADIFELLTRDLLTEFLVNNSARSHLGIHSKAGTDLLDCWLQVSGDATF